MWDVTGSEIRTRRRYPLHVCTILTSKYGCLSDVAMSQILCHKDVQMTCFRFLGCRHFLELWERP